MHPVFVGFQPFVDTNCNNQTLTIPPVDEPKLIPFGWSIQKEQKIISEIFNEMRVGTFSTASSSEGDEKDLLYPRIKP